MRVIRISNSAYQYLKEKAKKDKKSLIDIFDFVLEIFKQVTTKITFEQPKQGTYNTYRKAFYEQNKHLLKEHEKHFYESNKERMNLFFKENKEKLQIFKVAFMEQRKKTEKERLNKYNKQYYQKRKNVQHNRI